MQNINVVPKPKNILSNDAIVLAVSLILWTGKWIKLFTETVFAPNIHFQHIGLKLQENQVHYSKERKFFV